MAPKKSRKKTSRVAVIRGMEAKLLQSNENVSKTFESSSPNKVLPPKKIREPEKSVPNKKKVTRKAFIHAPMSPEPTASPDGERNSKSANNHPKVQPRQVSPMSPELASFPGGERNSKSPLKALPPVPILDQIGHINLESSATKTRSVYPPSPRSNRYRSRSRSRSSSPLFRGRRSQRRIRSSSPSVDQICNDSPLLDARKEKSPLGHLEGNSSRNKNLIRFRNSSSSSLERTWNMSSLQVARKKKSPLRQHLERNSSQRKQRNTQKTSNSVTVETLAPMLRELLEHIQGGDSSISTISQKRVPPKRRACSSPVPGSSGVLTQRSPRRQVHSSGVEVEIEPDSGVYVSESVLKIDVLRFKNRPSEMVRRLMLILVGRDELKKMTARGRLTNPSQKGKPKPRKAVPEKILYAVKYFIDRHGSPLLNWANYTRIVNQQCGSLRNPRWEMREGKRTQNYGDKQSDEDGNSS